MSRIVIKDFDGAVADVESCGCGGYVMNTVVNHVIHHSSASLICRCERIKYTTMDGHEWIRVIDNDLPFSVSGQPNR